MEGAGASLKFGRFGKGFFFFGSGFVFHGFRPFAPGLFIHKLTLCMVGFSLLPRPSVLGFRAGVLGLRTFAFRFA